MFSRDGRAFGKVVQTLFALQHRGQESCGIAYVSGKEIHFHKDMGWVRDVFPRKFWANEAVHFAIGHTRYPTQGNVDVLNAQPHIARYEGRNVLALVSNGDLVNYYSIRKALESEGLEFESENDGELLVKYLFSRIYVHKQNVEQAIGELMREVKGAYSAVLLTPEAIYVFRDPLGIRPFIYGYDPQTQSYYAVSESCALDILGIRDISAIAPGEVLRLDERGVNRLGRPVVSTRHSHCVFELIYFSRPDSLIFDLPPPKEALFPPEKKMVPLYIHHFRKELGRKLAERDKGVLDADYVLPIPDSGNFIALGYAEATGIPFQMGLIRSHYVGRTFIRPEQRYRDQDVREKFNPVPGLLENKKIVVIDDSIVRGTTLKLLIRMLRKTKVKEIHLRIGSPPMRYPCYYGIDTPKREELIANQAGFGPAISQKEIERAVGEYLGVDSLHYLSLAELKSIAQPIDQFCYACFSG
ncbi:MAG: amidophosphoribosyltransferase, partial [bacterium]